MNCNNCGAPLRPVAGRDHFCCEHCSTYHFPSELADSADRITPLYELSEIECPTCMAPLMHGALDGARVLFCETCRGILSESESFAHVVRQRRQEFDGADATPQPLDHSQLSRKLACPQCRRAMETHAYYGPGNAVVDSCAACRVIWLDHGELAAIERAPGRR